MKTPPESKFRGLPFVLSCVMVAVVLPINGKRLVPLRVRGRFSKPPDSVKGGLSNGYIF